MSSWQWKVPCGFGKLSTRLKHPKDWRRLDNRVRTLRIFSARAGAGQKILTNTKHQNSLMVFSRMTSIRLIFSESGNVGNVLWLTRGALVCK
jgi:hypothetical protein